MQSQQDVYDSLFIFLVNESIQYVFSKNLDKKTQKQEIEELGIQLGEKVTNNLLNSDKSRATLEKNSVDNYFQFISKNVWEFIFQDSNCQLTKENEGANYLITSGDIKLYNYLVTEKGNQNDQKLEAILNFICGIIKGALNVFNIECIVSPNVSINTKNMAKDSKITPNSNSYIFVFNINVFNNNNDADGNKNIA